MKKHLQDAISSPSFKASKLKRRMLLAALAAGSFCAMPAMAQKNLDYKAFDGVNTTGTYTDLGTSGTAITVANNDNANSAAQPIGFTFNFNGTNFTDFTLNTNGFIKLGTTAISSTGPQANIFSSAFRDANIIAPLSGVDLQGAANQTTNPTEFRVATTGTAPNRVTTIQFENLSDKQTGSGTSATPSQFSVINFQVKLYEGTNNIEFVYGPWTSSGNTAGPQFFVIALKGTTGGENDRLGMGNLPTTGTSLTPVPWAQTRFEKTTVFGGNPYIPTFVGANALIPDAGRTFRFVKFATPANDLSVETVFSQGKISVASGTPHRVQAVIKNTGTATATNQTINLEVSGTNTVTSTATIASLAPNDTAIVTFPGYLPTTAGSNLIEVTVPTDGYAENDFMEFNQFVSASTENYAVYPDAASDAELESATAAPIGNTFTTNSGVWLSRYFATNRLRVESMRTYIAGDNTFTTSVNTIGRTVFAVVVDAAGNVLARSADKVLTVNDVDDYVNFTFTTPAIVENQDYYVGMGMLANAAATKYAYPFSVQFEDLDRMGAQYVMPIPGATPTPPVDAEFDYRFMFETEVTNITGVKEDLNAKLVSVYPNPSNGVFNVSAKDMKGSNLNLEVRDMQGRLVYSAAASKDNATLDLKNVASGVYMLKASTDAEVAVKRIVVK
ncbi:T9SS type A sorting domain-containing protein [Adhaeribacter terreus]|uniref:T9SS type A sorting domain-containing protein n=1 Tax=Adhaeribacter terreus TaxID=529703 RepID=A0ABW0E8Z2_9BACT